MHLSDDAGPGDLGDVTGSDAAVSAGDERVDESSAADADDGAAVNGDAADGVASQPDAPGDEQPATSDSGDAGGPTDATSGGDGTAPRDAGDATDASGPRDGSADAAADAMCTAAGTCLDVPQGWTLVAFAPTQSSSCPSGFGQAADVVEGPDAANACGCGTCGVTTQPSCGAGPIDVFYDTIAGVSSGTCNLPGTVTPLGDNPPGACHTDLYQGDYRLDDIEYVPPGPSGGVCSTPGVKASGSVTYATRGRTCAPASLPTPGCNGNVCTPTVGGPYAACITAPGAVACPSGPLTSRHVVGTDATFDCSACGCTVTGGCTGTVTLYSDSSCRKAPVPVPADGNCYRFLSLSSTPPAPSYNSYTYVGNAPTNVSCSTSGASSAQNVALSNEATICCAP
jgi:hypothetical protein